LYIKNFFEKNFQAKTKTFDYGIFCNGTNLHIKEMDEKFFKGRNYNSCLEGRYSNLTSCDGLSSERSTAAFVLTVRRFAIIRTISMRMKTLQRRTS